MSRSVFRLTAAAALALGLMTPHVVANAQTTAPEVLAKMPPAAALECTKTYMAGKKVYYLARQEGLNLVFERGIPNPWVRLQLFMSPNRTAFERVNVTVQAAGTGSRITMQSVVVVRPHDDADVTPTAVTVQPRPEQDARVANLVSWINAQSSPNDCY